MKIEFLGRLRLIAVCALTVLGPFLMKGQASSEGTFGRYIGVLRHANIQRDQLAKLDFILSHKEGNAIELKAILTLHFGDFQTGDYIAYHFNHVRFNVLTQTLVFDQGDQPVTLMGKLSGTNRFEGELRSLYGEMGSMVLTKNTPADPLFPVMESLWGEYRGKCYRGAERESSDTTVQLYTYRSNASADLGGNPFQSYQIKGLIAERGAVGVGCGLNGDRECVWANIDSGSYNFFENRLQLIGGYRNLSCTVETGALKCEGCDLLVRVDPILRPSPVLLPPQAFPSFGEAEPTGRVILNGEISTLQGKYTGYLHHEFLDRYQVGGLNLLSYQAPAETGEGVGLRMSALATLYFGEANEGEAISYRFKERAFPNPLVSSQFVLSQPEGNTDAILQITSLGNGIARGVWFSQVFGRVGTFEFRKDGSTSIPESSKKMERVSGRYIGHEWDIQILVGLGAVQPNSANPFAPLTFGGWMIYPGVTHRIPIVGGSLDFYTGRIGLELEGKIIQLGRRYSRRKLELKKLHHAITAPLRGFPLEPYKLYDDQ